MEPTSAPSEVWYSGLALDSSSSSSSSSAGGLGAGLLRSAWWSEREAAGEKDGGGRLDSSSSAGLFGLLGALLLSTCLRSDGSVPSGQSRLGLDGLFGPTWVTFGRQWLRSRRSGQTRPSYLCEGERVYGHGSSQLPVVALRRQRRRRFLGRRDGAAVFLVPKAPQGRDADPRAPAVHHVVQLAPAYLARSQGAAELQPRPRGSRQGSEVRVASSPGSSWRSGVP